MAGKTRERRMIINRLRIIGGMDGDVNIAGALATTGIISGGHRHPVQALTASGAAVVSITSGLLTLSNATTAITATKAAPVPGDELYIINTSASGTAAHTVTLPAGVTWDGTNRVATLNAPGAALHVIAVSATRFFILENIGAVGLSNP